MLPEQVLKELRNEAEENPSRAAQWTIGRRVQTAKVMQD